MSALGPPIINKDLSLCQHCGQARGKDPARHSQSCIGAFVETLDDHDRALLRIPENWHTIVVEEIQRKQATS